VTEIVNRVEASIRRAVPSARVIYLEPDIFRTTLPADLDPPPANTSGDSAEPRVEAAASAPSAAADDAVPESTADEAAAEPATVSTEAADGD